MKRILMPQNKSPRTERGNVFLIILLGIAMFAALAFMISRSMQSDSVSSMSERTRELAVADIITYAQSINRAVNRVMRNGCSENEISFENNFVAGYANASTTSDKCKIFSKDGGGATWRKAPEGSATDLDWRFVTNRLGTVAGTKNLGTSGEDLMIMLVNVNLDVCNAINDKVNDYTRWESGGAHNQTVKFTGTYSAGSTGINRGNNWPLPETGCFCDIGGACTDAAPNYFYHALLTR